MNEYETLGHMSEIQEELDGEELNYYLPHHAVVKESSYTTKVRIVFDASMKSDSGLSLNEVQHIGPTIQPDLFSIILRFRMYKYVMTADISKMYRMVWLDPNQRQFQRIFWCDNISSNIKCYELKTITYGMASAPYLAIRCLFKLASEYEKYYPSACNAIRNNFYVDDFLCGADTEVELIQLQRDVSKILSSAGFELRKWRCNREEICKQFRTNNELDISILPLGSHEANKTLGIGWDAREDTIQYTTSITKSRTVNKRTILSEISQIYDPLGLLGPIIVVSKLIIQKLWESKISWDEQGPKRLEEEWLRFREELKFLEYITIGRQVTTTNCTYVELHGFADASERAYGACIYIRCRTEGEQFSTKLLCAKSRVAPLKKVTLPRLELCSAVLLAQLMQKVRDSIINIDKQYFWSDSKITLAWIKASPNRWKTFVANRVSEIQRLTNTHEWNHVASRENPADLLSRGASVRDIAQATLWWSGPAWLSDNEFTRLDTDGACSESEIRNEQRSVAHMSIDNHLNIFDKYSNFQKLQTTVAWCLRFISNCKLNNEMRQLNHTLTTIEMQDATNVLVKLAQRESFPREYHNLQNNKAINPKSSLVSLNPFMENNLLRVGGRLRQSSYEFDKKHPIILPARHKVTRLILIAEHIRLLHCGPTMLLSSIRERFWPVTGRNLAKKIVRDCIRCFRTKPRTNDYLMGDLPQNRIQQYLPFVNTGVDYAGPFLLKDRYTRMPKLIKGYVCLFICMATKAVHLEAVSDLTTECFMAKRLIARRGQPLNIYSDNGTNFIGACAELKKLQSFLCDENENICNSLSKQNINWHFIPAHSPNFGGLWEAGIKSAKFHFKRVCGNARLNFEDFTTILTQIEAILNSRPLCPLTSNPDNLNPLTPGHFLIGRRLTTISEPSYVDIKENRIKRFQRLQQIIQHFWRRWQKEYVSELQTRVKWRQNAPKLLQVGSIVLLKEDNIPPLQWPPGEGHRIASRTRRHRASSVGKVK